MKEKFIDYERKQYIESKRHCQHGICSCGEEEIKSKKYLTHGTVEENINKIKEVIDKMIAAGYETDSFRLQIAFAKEHDEKNDIVQDIDTRIDGLEATLREIKEATVKKTSSKK